MHSLNLNCATQGEQLKNCFENSLGELRGEIVSWKSNERDWHGRVDWESSSVAKLVVKSLYLTKSVLNCAF